MLPRIKAECKCLVMWIDGKAAKQLQNIYKKPLCRDRKDIDTAHVALSLFRFCMEDLLRNMQKVLNDYPSVPAKDLQSDRRAANKRILLKFCCEQQFVAEFVK